ncbi:MAG TPA: hypothetical protein VFD60_12810 [Nitrososphaeraceae archaeon]|jgi:hypothetical protein|nr:hypothetical protein [Nitrososphaeraceae archaeon]
MIIWSNLAKSLVCPYKSEDTLPLDKMTEETRKKGAKWEVKEHSLANLPKEEV